ncbi:MAG TPA: thiamine pyrophosphate-dependent enzyme, partial [Actinoplanes sp.]|nr:thiamine pyrophosphate-dependent enzyme [Actinoplanes sp.]
MQPPQSPREPDAGVRDGAALSGARTRELFDAQLVSRHLDLAARWLRSFNEGFYTVGSSGHEGNAAVAAALRPDDPALLHHRSAAFYCVRAAQAGAGQVVDPGDDPDVAPDPLIEAARDVLRGVVGSALDPVTGGRDKAFGRADLRIIPTTGAGMHLPRAVGVAFGVDRADRIGGIETRWPADAVVLASFGDASLNHAAVTTALNTAGWYGHRDIKLPLLLVCEDNGLGGGVGSPAGWVAETLRTRPGLRYTAADGCDLAAAYDAAVEAADWVREHRRPAVLHLSTVRLMGHDAADNEVAYRSAEAIAADLAR